MYCIALAFLHEMFNSSAQNVHREHFIRMYVSACTHIHNTEQVSIDEAQPFFGAHRKIHI